MVLEAQVPQTSSLELGRLKSAYLVDAFQAPLKRRELAITDLFAAIFGHHTASMKAALVARNAVVRVFGLEVPSLNEILRPHFRAAYMVGDKIGPWNIYHLSDGEIIVGRDNTHLDFRMSLHKGDHDLTVTTVCNVNNAFGAPYLQLVKPFHRYGVQALLKGAVRADRI